MHRSRAVILYGVIALTTENPLLLDAVDEEDKLTSFEIGYDSGVFAVGLEDTATHTTEDSLSVNPELTEPREEDTNTLQRFLSNQDIQDQPRWLLLHNVT